MKIAEVTHWAAEHPAASIAIGSVGVLVVLWLLGVFDKPPQQSSDGGAANMAAAYYAAEAQQAVVGGQIQQTALTTAAATAQTKIVADAGVAINQQNANASLATTQSNNDTAAAIADTGAHAALMHDFINTIIPAEFATYGAGSFATSIPGVGLVQTGLVGGPDQARAAGYSETQIARQYGGA